MRRAHCPACAPIRVTCFCVRLQEHRCLELYRLVPTTVAYTLAAFDFPRGTPAKACRSLLTQSRPSPPVEPADGRFVQGAPPTRRLHADATSPESCKGSGPTVRDILISPNVVVAQPTSGTAPPCALAVARSAPHAGVH